MKMATMTTAAVTTLTATTTITATTTVTAITTITTMSQFRRFTIFTDERSSIRLVWPVVLW